MFEKISILILTYNEALHIERCLLSAKNLTEDITLIDSFSTDSTLEIAKKLDSRVVQNAFISHAHQINWALDHVSFADR